MTTAVQTSTETLSINAIRMLSVDAVETAKNGHPGLPLGAAAMAYVVWNDYLRFNPKDPAWFDRDRFVLSAGHGSALLYSLLHLYGYDVSIEDLKKFREMGSITPGHPEVGITPGVELTTGPLGQGFANGVGFAIAEAFLAAKYNRSGHEVIDHYTFGIVSDGDVMEGVAFEAAAIAGHLELGKLIYLYDQNHISLAGSTDITFTEDVGARFRAMGWQTIETDGMDPDAVRSAIDQAKAETGKPSLILCRTIIGFGSPKKANTFGVHGSPLGAEEARATKEALGWPTEPAFYVPEEVTTAMAERVVAGAAAQQAWQEKWDAYRSAFPDLAAELSLAISGGLSADWDEAMPSYDVGGKVATRKASGDVLAAIGPKLPTLIGGSADLNSSTNTALKGLGDFQAPDFDSSMSQGGAGGGWSYAGQNVHWGVREHGMASAVNGLAAHGGTIPFGSTFLVFADYLRPAVRLAALSHYKSIWVFTHDSIAVGGDGPTHEPVEQVMSMRAIPHLTVIRPADGNETVEAWRHAVTSDRSTALIFSRQDLPILDRSGARGDLSQGGYILRDTAGAPDVVLVATGSEVSLAGSAADLLAEHGVHARVVSLPSWELFEAQDAAYRESVMGPIGTVRVTVEAGTTLGWAKYAGDRGACVGVDTFGASGPGEEVMAAYGFTTEHVAAVALSVLGQHDLARSIDETWGGNVTSGPIKPNEGHS
ncbi:MAG: Transketolase [uncultured Thermomicrobiales bacterium]|uniref:Transketolase n=1 Tax=uncultured Thermomicrobiales bacterium TaxID=1645740 RepID=A0A6J4V4V0_9BACT|nr:MAG: Transketolase [uncultured Thermomicrobiales bacterium]